MKLISKFEYEQAIKIITEYENQQKVLSEKLNNKDLNLLDADLSTRAKTILTENQLYSISDVIEQIKNNNQNGSIIWKEKYIGIIRLRNVGNKTYYEIINFIEDYLNIKISDFLNKVIL